MALMALSLGKIISETFLSSAFPACRLSAFHVPPLALFRGNLIVGMPPD